MLSNELKEQFTNELVIRKINHYLVNILNLPKDKYLLTNFNSIIRKHKIFVRIHLESEKTGNTVCLTLEGKNSINVTRYNWDIGLPHEIKVLEDLKIWDITGRLIALDD